MKNLRERIYINQEELFTIERKILNERHVYRYGLVRKFLYGNVIDFGCGCGYGSFLCSLNPDVEKITGVDISDDAVNWGKVNFKNDKTDFKLWGEECTDFIDILMAIEFIEHIQDPKPFIKYVNSFSPKYIIMSYPTKKTTHYNKFHFHDYRRQDILDMFPDYHLLNAINIDEEIELLRLIK